MNKVKTGEIIKNARLIKGYTQQELGDMIGVTNKAVSRWENGESFPDITLLDSLAQALEIHIEEIVLGEKKNEVSNETVKEIVDVAKIQKKQRDRNTWFKIVTLVIASLILYQGFHTFIKMVIDWSIIVYFYSLIVILLLISIITEGTNQITVKNVDRGVKAASVVSIFSGIYIAILMITSMKLYEHGIKIFGLEETDLGPFVDKQLSVVFIVNFLFSIALLWKCVKDEEKTITGIYFSVCVCHLALIYSDLLHRLVSPEDFVYTYAIGTVVPLLIMLCVLLINVCCRKYRFKKCQEDNDE